VQPVALEVGHYRLDAPVARDAPVVARALADPDIALWNPSASAARSTSAERAVLWIADRAQWAADHASWVVRGPDGVVVGAVSLHHLDDAMRTGEIGYWMLPASRGRGIGAAAVDAAARYGFDSLGLVRLELYHAVENVASCRLAERCGFAHEGTARQSFVYGDGLRHDEHLHGRLADDAWPAVPAPS
jgi:RimJ/RimL family protein N-acetyltransferase